MALAFDTLGYAKRLRDGGVPPEQAETHAEAARDFIMIELVTKADLHGAVEIIDGKVALCKADLQTAIEILDGKIALTKADLQTAIEILDRKVALTKAELQRAIEALDRKIALTMVQLETKLEAKIDAVAAKLDKVSLRILVSLGGMIAAAVAALGALMRLG